MLFIDSEGRRLVPIEYDFEFRKDTISVACAADWFENAIDMEFGLTESAEEIARRLIR